MKDSPLQPDADGRVRCSALLGEQWTDDEIGQARHVLSAIYEGVPVNLSVEEMERLSNRGLVYDIKKLPGRGRYANRFTFEWRDKLEALVRAAACSPNDSSSATAATKRPD